jgi:hypothetical protein
MSPPSQLANVMTAIRSLPPLESQCFNDRFTYNAAPHTLASNQLSLFIALAEKLISNLRMQIAK